MGSCTGIAPAAAVIAGEEIPADLQSWQFILESPNRYQYLVTMMEDPDKAIEFISLNCMDEVVQGTEAILLLNWVDDAELAKLDAQSEGRILQCVDNFGALSAAARCEI